MGKITTRDVLITISALLAGIASTVGTIAGASAGAPVASGTDAPAIVQRFERLEASDVRQEAQLGALLTLACKTYPDDTVCASRR